MAVFGLVLIQGSPIVTRGGHFDFSKINAVSFIIAVGTAALFDRGIYITYLIDTRFLDSKDDGNRAKFILSCLLLLINLLWLVLCILMGIDLTKHILRWIYT